MTKGGICFKLLDGGDFMKKEDGVYTRINGEEKLIAKPPENGFGKTTITWSHGKPTTAENVQTIKLNK